MPASSTQFTAGHLFYAVSLSAVSTALFGVVGLPIAAFVGLVWWQILSGARREADLSRERQSAPAKVKVANGIASSEFSSKERCSGFFKIELAVVLLISAILLGLLIPARSDTDPMQHAEISMQVVARAIADYEKQHGEPLPAVVCDEQGNPLHSWRALILRELGEGKLASAYRLDEPWNGPNNSQLARYRPWHYRIYCKEEEPGSQSTSVHLLDVGGMRLVAEQEQICESWLKPSVVSESDWNRLNCVPALDEGFWWRGFFSSTYRGRLLVSPVQTWIAHADTRISAAMLSNQVHEFGKPYRKYHVSNALRLVAFLLVALYPIRWIQAIRNVD